MADVGISLSEQENAFLELQVSEGRYGSASEYITELIRVDAQKQLTEMVRAGLASPYRESTDELWAEIRRTGVTRLGDRK